MKFDLTRDQALELSRAAHLVTEYLPVTESKRKALSKAQQAIFSQLGLERQLAGTGISQDTPPSESEHRGLLVYSHGFTDHTCDTIDINVSLTVYYDRTHEEVEVTLTFDNCTFSVEDVADKYYTDEGDHPFPDVAFYCFPGWYGACVQLRIHTPTGKKEASYLLTKETVVIESQTIKIEVEIDDSTGYRSITYKRDAKEPA